LHSKNAKITVIPNNTEKFIGFQIDGIRYLDSIKFLPSSLDNLVQNLHNDGIEPFKCLTDGPLMTMIRTFFRKVSFHMNT